MDHSLPLISILAAAFGLAWVMGLAAVRLGLPPLVGYLLAGIAIGPATPGFVADMALAGELAEVGVMLLMFGVGLHFSLDDLLAVRRIAVPGAVLQIVVATAMGAGAALAWGWSTGAALVFGLALSVASTVVLLKALEARGQLDTGNGRIALGWLVVEDLAMVGVLVLLPPLAAPPGAPAVAPWALALDLGKTVLAVAGFIALMLVAGRRVFPWLLWQVARTGSRELFSLSLVAAAVGIAYASASLFGVSFALGAFFAGMVLRESRFCHRADRDSQPLRDTFAVLFFVSVGMLFDPQVLVREPVRVLLVVAIIVLGKSVAAAVLVLALRQPLATALTVSASLAQIGEFSFILASLGMSLELLPRQGYSLVLAGALISIALNPLAFHAIDWLASRPATRFEPARREDPLAELPRSTDPRYLADHVVLVGHGRVGQAVARALAGGGQAFVVADRDRQQVERLRAAGQAAVYGDGRDAETLVQSHVAQARMLVVATPDTVGARQMIAIARMINPDIALVVRCPDGQDAQRLRRDTGATALVAESELAAAMAQAAMAGRG